MQNNTASYRSTEAAEPVALTSAELDNVHGGFASSEHAFLKIDGVKGESQDHPHKDDIHVLS